MPTIAELREIDGAMWALIPVSQDEGRIQLLSDAEIAAASEKMQRILTENDRLRAALVAIAALAQFPEERTLYEAGEIASAALG